MALSDKEIGLFRNQLSRRRDVLRQVVDEEIVHHERENYEDILGRVRDTGDESLARSIADLNIRTLDRELEEMRDIDDALKRMGTGEYGVCADCGEDIQLARLSAYPTARRCLACQRHYEVSHAGRARPSL